jgi:predicted peroxiredoxin
MRNFIIAAVLTIACMFATGPASAVHSAKPTCGADELFLNLTSDETWRSGMALNTAKRNLEAGYQVTVFLNVEAVRIAVREEKYRHDTYPMTGLTSLQTLQQIIDMGARVIVCPGCLERSGFKPHELISGVYLGGPMPQIIRCSTVQLSY